MKMKTSRTAKLEPSADAVSLSVRERLREEGGSAESKEYSWTDSAYTNHARRFHTSGPEISTTAQEEEEEEYL